MAKVNTNDVSIQFAVESAVGVLPASPQWRTLEPNSLSTFGANITTTSRRPISPTRGRKKGTVINKESAVEYDADMTMDAFSDFAEGYVFSEFANVEFDMRAGGATPVPPPAASSTTFTVDSVSTLLAGKAQWVTTAQASLFYGKGYTNAGNNGLHVLTVDVAATDTTLTFGGSSLVAETPATSASLQLAGMRSAIGDLALTVSGSTATIVSAADISDWSTLGLFVGQYVHVGSADTAGAVQNMFDDGSGGDVYGYGRISAISGATLSLDKIDPNLSTTDASNATVVDLMFGRFLRNVEVTADSDDTRYLSRTYQFETVYPDLGGVGTDEYEYAIGNHANSLAINFPLIEKATATFGFIGTNSDDITPTRKTNAASSVSPLRTVAINTSSDMASITTDVISSVSDVCFKSMTLTIANNVSPENCLGTLGASNVNTGLFQIDLEAQMQFTNKAIVNAVTGNTTVTFATIVANDDGAIAIDIPALTFGGGDREYPIDETVLVNLTGEAFNDPVGAIPNVSLGISLFATVPTS